ncbi:MAG TPA: exodeoxyribonuclease VII small subunit [Candidatus Sulfotelmatobacter sp.]|nr:exodeoxyribonuclease VII small subunit [Candidatus Sulfotelmatobacter sp.]
MADSRDVGALTYEQALAELDSLIAKLEGGAVNLDEAVACYERGSQLASHCSQLLDRTEQRVTQLVVGGTGALSEKPLQPESAGEVVQESATESPPNGAAPNIARPVRSAGLAQPPAPAAPPGRGMPRSDLPRSRAVPSPAEDIDPDDIPF